MRERIGLERELGDLEIEYFSVPPIGTSGKIPIIFVPGVMGSELERDGERVWPTTDSNTALSLELDENGRDSGNPVIPTKVMRTIPVNTGPHGVGISGAVYEGFFTFFTGKDAGYVEKKNLFEFPYDWRKDLEMNAYSLGLFVQNVLEITKNDKVILIAHSLGGLVARAFMMNPSVYKNVEKFIILGTPHHGAPKYLSLLLFGKEWPLPWIVLNLREDESKQLVRNFASIYQGTLDSTSPFPTFFNDNGAVKPEDLNSVHLDDQYNESMIQRSINFHAALNSNWYRFPFYNTFLIVSLGKSDTINAIYMNKGKFDHYDYESPIKGVGSGDGTIPGFSSTRISLDTKTEKEYTHVDKFHNVDHQELATTNTVLKNVLDIINMTVYKDNPGPLPVWELRNKTQEKGQGPLQEWVTRKEIVNHLQTALAKLGCSIGTIDGIFGSITKSAVIQFQKKNTDFKNIQLKDDGIVGPLTSDSINRALIGIWYKHADYFTPKILEIQYYKVSKGMSIPIEPLPGLSLLR
jgi:pimeloyl-ACP methyl ester carboxylesterase